MNDYIIYIAAAVMPISIIGIILERIVNRRGFGARTIQFATVCLLLPSILILSYSSKLSSEATATILGALTGYLLSEVGKFQPRHKKRETPTDKKQPP